MKHNFLPIIGIVLLSLSLTSCGGGGSTPANDGETTDNDGGGDGGDNNGGGDSSGGDNGDNNGGGQGSAVTINAINFTPIAISASDNEKKQMRVTPHLSIAYSDQSTKEFDLSYKTLLRSGDTIGGQHAFGTITDKDGNALTEDNGSPMISLFEDSNSVLSAGNKHWLVTHFEHIPGALYQTEIKRSGVDLQAVSTKSVDFKALAGTAINCAGSKSGWNTHLGGEELYYLNSREADSASPFYESCGTDNATILPTKESGGWSNFCYYINSMQRYLHDNTIDANNGYNGNLFTPYNYGYTIEVAIKDDGTPDIARHYVTGKYTPELAISMPDGKTLYMSDDGSAKGFYKFVSDSKITGFQKNWTGTLYIAKFTQKTATNSGTFDIDWIELGHASDNEIKALVDSKMKLTDMFEITDVTANTCQAGFKKIYSDGKATCLKLKSGKEKAAAFLETRKYGAYLGGTTELRKEEGITYDRDKNVVYLAISTIGESMEDNYENSEAANHIRLAANKCGAVYELALDGNYSATGMKALIAGQPLQKSDAQANQFACHPDKISNPDNISYIGANQLLIGEDTLFHVNNYLWVLDTKTSQLTRIASLPIGSEVTGLAHAEIGDKSSLFLNIQHPFTDSPKNASDEQPNLSLIQSASPEDRKGSVGYIDGIPTDVFH